MLISQTKGSKQDTLIQHSLGIQHIWTSLKILLMLQIQCLRGN